MMSQSFLMKKVVGYTTSSNFSFYYKKNICLAYIMKGFQNYENLCLEIEGKKYPLNLEKKPIHDPTVQNIAFLNHFGSNFFCNPF